MACQNETERISGAFVLTPAEGKKLIGLAVASLPEVKWAHQYGRLVVANGSTTGYVLEALTGQAPRRFNYCIGMIANGLFAQNLPEDRDKMAMWRKGERVSALLADFIKEFEAGDVFIKGANAVDPNWYAGGLMANPNGGSWGEVIGVLAARGAHCIVPVGLEKMIPSVIEASRKMGQKRLTYSLGSPVGLLPITTAKVITEVQALEILAGVCATPVAAGGIGGSEGSVALVVEGSRLEVKKAFGYVKQVKGEKPVELTGQVTCEPHQLPEGW